MIQPSKAIEEKSRGRNKEEKHEQTAVGSRWNALPVLVRLALMISSSRFSLINSINFIRRFEVLIDEENYRKY